MRTKKIIYSIGSSMLTVLLLSSCHSTDEQNIAYGEFEATEVIVSAQTSGEVVHLNVDEGQVLQPQEEVGLIDTTQLFLQKLMLIKQGASVRSTRPEVYKQIASLKTQIAYAKKDLVRLKNLELADAATEKQVDDATTHLQVLIDQLVALRSTLATTNQHIDAQSSVVDIQVAQVQDQIEKSQIASPIYGTVLAKYLEAGEWAAPGKPVFKVANLEAMYLRAYVTSLQLEKIQIGQHVKVDVDYGQNVFKTYDGEIYWISDKNGFTPKTIQTADSRASMVYAIKVRIKNDGSVKIGMSGQIHI